ncbi:hypothetical protein ZWY2020_011006, partial [Hordeum vulgare]
ASRWAEEAESRHRAEEEAKAAAAVDGDGDVDNNVYTSEDEGTENYGRGGYHGAYVMQSKLGWGHFSTAWVAWDTAHSRYVALKVQKSAQHYSEADIDEIKILRQIADGDLEDSRCVVKLLDHFKHTSPNWSHVCMVFEFLGDNLLTLIKYTDYRGIPLPMVKEICRHVLIGLDYLHRELSIIHTDLKPENIFLVSTIDPSNDPRKSCVPLVPPAARAIEPPPRAPARPSTSSGKAKYVVASTSKGNGAVAFADIDESDDKGDLSTANEGSPSQDGDKKRGGGHRWGNKGTRNRMAMEAELGCKLVDFGNACWTYKQFTSDIQTRKYRCPEVLLGSKYSTSVDLWSFACICFELASGDVLFDPHSGDNFDRDEVFFTFDDLLIFLKFLGIYSQDFSNPTFNIIANIIFIMRLKFFFKITRKIITPIMIIATSRRHSKTSIPKLRVLHIFSTIVTNRIYSETIAIMLFIQGALMNHFISFFITIFRFTHLKQNSIKIVKCTQLTSNWFNISGSLKEISKWVRIHITRFSASEDASILNAHGNTSNQKTSERKGERKRKTKKRANLFVNFCFSEVGERKTVKNKEKQKLALGTELIS